MSAETRIFRSTSRNTAVTEDIELRKTNTTRLVFRPMLVENEHDQEACVKGWFIFQRKGKSDNWEDLSEETLSGFKSGEGIKLEVKSEELRTLHSELSALYDLYRSQGIPKGVSKFVRANPTILALTRMSDDELSTVVFGNEVLGAQAMARLIKWASHAKNLPSLFSRLQELDQGDLAQLSSALGMETLKRALKDWLTNRANDAEEFWQKTFAKYAFVLEQVFQLPIVVLKSKAYVGGKSVLNIGGNVVDFLVKNRISNAVGLVEIKTPATHVLGARYRGGAYSASPELSGAVIQVLTYRDSLIEERAKLLGAPSVRAEAFDPLCVVIIGDAERELSDDVKRRSFELYRRQLGDVRVVTFDEVFECTKRLVELLEQGVSQEEQDSQPTGQVPF